MFNSKKLLTFVNDEKFLCIQTDGIECLSKDQAEALFISIRDYLKKYYTVPFEDIQRRLDFFAAHAPTDIPEWFHKYENNMIDFFKWRQYFAHEMIKFISNEFKNDLENKEIKQPKSKTETHSPTIRK